KAKEMGIDWWEHDPSLSSRARTEVTGRGNTEVPRGENREATE
ncbi:hypothetical protein GA0115260_107656, partial [Streptomyces sp. MnatMP-M27]